MLEWILDADDLIVSYFVRWVAGNPSLEADGQRVDTEHQKRVVPRVAEFRVLLPKIVEP